MAVEINQAEAPILEVTLRGKLTHADYEQFVPLIEKRIARGGKLRLLARLEEFHGWTAGALWDDIRFDARHFRDIERLAIVGDRAWEHGMAVFCKPFTTAEVRYFERGDESEARKWLQGAAVPVQV